MERLLYAHNSRFRLYECAGRIGTCEQVSIRRFRDGRDEGWQFSTRNVGIAASWLAVREALSPRPARSTHADIRAKPFLCTPPTVPRSDGCTSSHEPR